MQWHLELFRDFGETVRKMDRHRVLRSLEGSANIEADGRLCGAAAATLGTDAVAVAVGVGVCFLAEG